MCIVCASVECIIWNNFRQKRLRPASEFSQPLSTRVLDTPIIFSYLLIFIFIKKKNLSYVIYIPIQEVYTKYKINFVQDNGWLIDTDSYCVVYPVPQFPPSPDLIPQQIQPQGHQTDASGEWKTMPHLLASRTICSNCN